MSVDDLSWTLPGDLQGRLEASIEEARSRDVIRRIWAADSSVWTGADEDQWLGWLNLPVSGRGELAHAGRFANSLKRDRITDLVLLGMGGSSLAADVMRQTFGRRSGHPILHLLDSTDPAQITAVERAIDLRRTVFLVASKSGSTLEPNILKQYFFQRVAQTVEGLPPGSRFVAVTDPGSKLHQAAERDGFREIFPGIPSVGGRYSALSTFGTVPAAAIGIDCPALLDGAETMARRCSPDQPVSANPALLLGAILGACASRGFDKITFIISPAIAGFGAWLEQLLAESTGKRGRGLIPIDGELPGQTGVYGTDRLFVYLRLDAETDASQEACVTTLEAAGHPIVRIAVKDRYGLGSEFFRWEMAAAVAGAFLGINPFDQPDVEESKIATRRLAAEFEKAGRFPQDTPLAESAGLSVFADDRNRRALAGTQDTLAGYLKAHLRRLRERDFFALLAYLEMSDANQQVLQRIRHLVRDRARAASCLGFGPRFLHSTGQLYKGGPDSGVFLQLTGDDAQDLPVPGQKYTFGAIKMAQARGDFDVLCSRGRRVVWVHLGSDVSRGLDALSGIVEEALQ